MVEQEVEGFGGEFEEVRLREEALFDRRVDLDNTALHYPLDIFDRGMYVYMCMCGIAGGYFSSGGKKFFIFIISSL